MLDRIGIRTAALSIAIVAGALEGGCSSDDSASSPALTPFDAGQVTVPEAGAAAPSTVTIQAQGQGSVISDDGTPDGGKPPTVTCTAGASASKCTAAQQMTIYAVPAATWVFTGWTTTGIDAGALLPEGANPSFTISEATPNPLIAIFTAQSGSSGSTPDSDAGSGSD